MPLEKEAAAMTAQTLTRPAAARSVAEERSYRPEQDFEAIYREARGDRARIRWSDGVPSPALVAWLNAVAPSLVRCGGRVAVVGCGLGEDARALIQRGYEVTAFDISPTAIDWARKLDAQNARSYHVADLFQPPARWRHRFELVVEINTLQSLLPDQREAAFASLRELLAPHGRLLVICRGREAHEAIDDQGPPWPLTEAELLAAASNAGLRLDGSIDSFEDDEKPPTHRLRALFRRF
jgi:SAM-dependent methyltransferase